MMIKISKVNIGVERGNDRIGQQDWQVDVDIENERIDEALGMLAETFLLLTDQFILRANKNSNSIPLWMAKEISKAIRETQEEGRNRFFNQINNER